MNDGDGVCTARDDGAVVRDEADGTLPALRGVDIPDVREPRVKSGWVKELELGSSCGGDSDRSGRDESAAAMPLNQITWCYSGYVGYSGNMSSQALIKSPRRFALWSHKLEFGSMIRVQDQL